MFARHTNPETGLIQYRAGGVNAVWTIARNVEDAPRKESWVLFRDGAEIAKFPSKTAAVTEAALRERTELDEAVAEASRQHLAELEVVHGVKVTLNNDRSVYTVDEILADGTLRLTNTDGGALPNVVCPGTLVAAVVERAAADAPVLTFRRGDVVELRRLRGEWTVLRLSARGTFEARMIDADGHEILDHFLGSEVVRVVRRAEEDPEIEVMRAKLSGVSLKEIGDPTMGPGDVAVFPPAEPRMGHVEVVGHPDDLDSELGNLLANAGIELVSVSDDDLVDGTIVEDDSPVPTDARRQRALERAVAENAAAAEVRELRDGETIVLSNGVRLETYTVNRGNDYRTGMIFTTSRGGYPRTFPIGDLAELLADGAAVIAKGPRLVREYDQAEALQMVKEAVQMHAREIEADVVVELLHNDALPYLRIRSARGTVELHANVTQTR